MVIVVRFVFIGGTTRQPDPEHRGGLTIGFYRRVLALTRRSNSTQIAAAIACVSLTGIAPSQARDVRRGGARRRARDYIWN